MKRIISLFLSLLMLFSVVTSLILGSVTAQAAPTYYEFGNYPQSEVTNSYLINMLKTRIPSVDTLDDNNHYGWTSYDFVSYGDTGFAPMSEWKLYDAYYCDVVYAGAKYRATAIKIARPSASGYAGGDTYKVTFFKWEPLRWLKVSDNQLLCEKLIYSNQYVQHIEKHKDGVTAKLYNAKNSYVDHNYNTQHRYNSSWYANAWVNSDARIWLNGTFYNEAFTYNQKNNINVENVGSNTAGGNTNDAVYLPSKWAVTEKFYEVKDSNAKRRATGTDYAKAMGLKNYDGIPYYFLRDGGNSDGTQHMINCVYNTGAVSKCSVALDSVGYRPCITVNSMKNDTEISDIHTGEYKKGDVITYGSYPQTRVTGSVVTELNKVKKQFRYMNWWHNGDRTLSTPGTFEEIKTTYADFMYNGEKYRAVHYKGGQVHGNNTINGYGGISSVNEATYYFKYEPLKWTVLNPSKGKVICNNVIAADCFNNYINKKKWVGTIGLYGGTTDGWAYRDLEDISSNNYYAWIGNDYRRLGLVPFTIKNQAFTKTQIENISDFMLPNRGDMRTNGYPEHDKLSYIRRAKPSDYALATGVEVDSMGNASYWLKNFPDGAERTAYYVKPDGSISDKRVTDNSVGIRPIMFLNEIKNDTSTDTNVLKALRTGEEIEFGYYPQAQEPSSSGLNSASKTWRSYRFFAGTGTPADGKMQGTDNMEFADFMYFGKKYRAVKINDYRPENTYEKTPAESSSSLVKKGETYYFEYQPIKWTVIDGSKSKLISQKFLDAQEFSTMSYKEADGSYVRYRSSDKFASKYDSSSIDVFLDKEFKSVAFSKNQILSLTADEKEYSSSGNKKYTNRDLYSKVTLPTESEAKVFDEAASFYSIWMGIDLPNGKSNIYTLTGNAVDDHTVKAVHYNGNKLDSINADVNDSFFGIRPVITLDEDNNSAYELDSSYLYSKDCEKMSNNISVSPLGSGTVKGAGTGFKHGEYINMSATPKDGFKFKNWQKNGTALDINDYPQDWFTIARYSEADEYTAVFEGTPVTVTLKSDGHGTVSKDGSNYSSSVTVNTKGAEKFNLYCKPNSGYTFAGWYNSKGEKVSSSPGGSLVCQGTDTYTAKFTVSNKTFTFTALPENASHGMTSGTGDYNANDICTLKATPKRGYEFKLWYQIVNNGQKKVESTSSTYQFTVDPDYMVSAAPVYYAEFEPTLCEYHIFTETDEYGDPLPGGKVKNRNYNPTTYIFASAMDGDSCTINAVPDEGYEFLGWYDSDGHLRSKDEEYTFTMKADDDLNFVAKFKKAYEIEIVTQVDFGSFKHGKIFNVYDENITFDEVSVSDWYSSVINDYYPESGYKDDDYITRVYLNGNQKIKPEEEFHLYQQNNLTISFEKKVNLELKPDNATHFRELSGGGTYGIWDDALITALPEIRYEFVGWYDKDGNLISENPSYYVSSIDEDTVITARSRPKRYTVKLTASPAEGGTVSGSGIYSLGTPITIKATPKSGYYFDGWYSDGKKLSTEASVSGNVDFSLDLVAKFNKNPEPISSLDTSGAVKPTETQVEKFVTSLPNDNDPKGTKFSYLLGRQKKVTKNALTITWQKPAGAAYFIVYGNKCGNANKYKKIAKVSSNTFTQKGLKKGTYYKYLICAFDKNGRLLGTTNTIHIATKGGKKGNYKSVTTKAKKNKVSLKKGKSFKLKAKAVKEKGVKKVSNHRAIRYESSNAKVATVSSKGVIKAKKKGKAYVFAYAQNGVYKKIKVTVK